MTEWQLRCELRAHEADVRALLVLPDGRLVSGARDNTAIVWQPESDSARFSPAVQLRGHSNWIGDVARLGGQLVTGGFDNAVGLWPLKEMEAGQSVAPLAMLQGHEGPVSSVDTAGDLLVTGSWDMTARLWRSGTCVQTLQGHQAAVGAVCCVDGGRAVWTGSSDKTVRVWAVGDDGAAVLDRSIEAHGDAVRGLAAVPVLGGVLSVGNDGEMRLWTTGGELLRSVHVHDEYTYALAVRNGDGGDDGDGDDLSGLRVATGSEDRTAKVWSGDLGTCQQEIGHPGVVWALCWLPDGDLVTGCSDGVVRVFTQTAERVAPEPDRKLFAELVAATVLANKSVGNVKLKDLPGPDGLKRAGKHDGESQMIREGGKAMCYQWSAAKSSWDLLGEVVETLDDKKTLNGKEYDFVFDVDIAEGQPPLKLGYNAGINPYEAAQDFLWQNDLPQDHLDTVAQFIIQNAGDSARARPARQPYEMEGGGGGGGHAAIDNYADPLTGGGRYVPGREEVSVGRGSAGANGGGGARAAPRSTNTAVQQAIERARQTAITPFPVFDFVVFNTGAPAKALERIEKSAADGDSMDTGEGSTVLSDAHRRALRDLVALLDGGEDTIKVEQVEALRAVVLQWPAAERFPAMDLMRLALTHRSAGAAGLPWLTVDEVVAVGLQPGLPMPCRMLSCRILANMFSVVSLRSGLRTEVGAVLEALRAVLDVSADQKSVLLGAATLLLNYVVIYGGDSAGEDRAVRELLMRQLRTVAAAPGSDGETVYRALVAIGTLAHDSAGMKAAFLQADGVGLLEAVQQSAVEKVVTCARALKRALAGV